MNRLFIFCALVLALLVGSAPATAQTAIATTTISAAITQAAPQQFNITVASATGIAAGGILWIDGSVYRVASTYASGTTVPVITTYRPATHLTSAVVFLIPLGAQMGQNPVGSCLRSTAGAFPAYSPYALMFNLAQGVVAMCRGTVGSRTWFLTSPYWPVVSSNPPQTP